MIAVRLLALRSIEIRPVVIRPEVIRPVLSRAINHAALLFLLALGAMGPTWSKSDTTAAMATYVESRNSIFGQTVTVAGIQLTGDPLTLITMSKLNLSGHDITVNRWQSPNRLDDVMEQLSTQVPHKTLAWGEEGVVSMMWEASDCSHHLMVTPLSDRMVEIVLSSIELVRSGLPNNEEYSLLSGNDNDNEIKKIFISMDPQAELLVDVKDKSVDQSSFTLLYALMRKLTDVDIELRHRLKEDGWLVSSVPERLGLDHSHHVIEAIRYQHQLRIDLINDFGKLFVHINQSGSFKLERNQRKS